MALNLTTRSVKGSPLEFSEIDANFLSIQGAVNTLQNAGYITSEEANTLIAAIDIPTVPTVVSAFLNDAEYQNLTQLNAAINNLQPVARSGNYADLVDAPTIPSIPLNVGYFTNDKNYQDAGQVNTAIEAVVGAAPDALNTLQEIATQLQNDESTASALTLVVTGKADKNLSNITTVDPTALTSLKTQLGLVTGDLWGNDSDYHDVTSSRTAQFVYYKNTRNYPIYVVMICNPASQNTQSMIQVEKGGWQISSYQNSGPIFSFCNSAVVQAGAQYRWYFSGMDNPDATVQFYELY